MKYFLAVDIGASSGRHIIGYKENDEIVLKEVYRFSNWVKEVNSHLIWDIESLVKEVKNGIKEALKLYPNIESMSIDTWAVDYVLLDKDDKEIMPVYAYRDHRTDNVIDKVHEIVPFEELYSHTGCQFQKFNTIYQLYDDKLNGRLDKACDYLMIPEYLMYKLTGVKKKEYTNASSMGLCEGTTLEISKEICSRLGYPEFVSQKIYKPGTVLGDFTKDIQEEVGGNIKVVLCSTHDTASAVEGISMKENAPYISSGTWSLLGIKEDHVISSKEAMKANYSNEYGPSYIRFQKNIMGMWIINFLSKELDMKVIDMVELSKKSSYKEIFNVNDEVFLSPKNMKEAIISYLKERNRPLPKDNGDLINSVYHSLAYSYKEALDELESITNKKYTSLYIVGGGAKNVYLNGLVEYYTNKNVVALPIEATALGNIKSQMEE